MSQHATTSAKILTPAVRKRARSPATSFGAKNEDNVALHGYRTSSPLSLKKDEIMNDARLHASSSHVNKGNPATMTGHSASQPSQSFLDRVVAAGVRPFALPVVPVGGSSHVSACQAPQTGMIVPSESRHAVRHGLASALPIASHRAGGGGGGFPPSASAAERTAKTEGGDASATALASLGALPCFAYLMTQQQHMLAERLAAGTGTSLEGAPNSPTAPTTSGGGSGGGVVPTSSTFLFPCREIAVRYILDDHDRRWLCAKNEEMTAVARGSRGAVISGSSGGGAAKKRGGSPRRNTLTAVKVEENEETDPNIAKKVAVMTGGKTGGVDRRDNDADDNNNNIDETLSSDSSAIITATMLEDAWTLLELSYRSVAGYAIPAALVPLLLVEPGVDSNGSKASNTTPSSSSSLLLQRFSSSVRVAAGRMAAGGTDANANANNQHVNTLCTLLHRHWVAKREAAGLYNFGAVPDVVQAHITASIQQYVAGQTSQGQSGGGANANGSSGTAGLGKGLKGGGSVAAGGKGSTSSGGKAKTTSVHAAMAASMLAELPVLYPSAHAIPPHRRSLIPALCTNTALVLPSAGAPHPPPPPMTTSDVQMDAATGAVSLRGVPLQGSTAADIDQVFAPFIVPFSRREWEAPCIVQEPATAESLALEQKRRAEQLRAVHAQVLPPGQTPHHPPTLSAGPSAVAIREGLVEHLGNVADVTAAILKELVDREHLAHAMTLQSIQRLALVRQAADEHAAALRAEAAFNQCQLDFSSF